MIEELGAKAAMNSINHVQYHFHHFQQYPNLHALQAQDQPH